MKLKSLKKIIKQHLFNFNISKNLFLIFEIQKDIVYDSKFIVQNFSKQIFNKLKQNNFQNLKFPIVFKKVNSLKDLLQYFLIFKTQNNFLTVFLVKIYFFFLKKKLFFLKTFFLQKKSLKFFFYIFFKKKGLLYNFKFLFYPFIVV